MGRAHFRAKFGLSTLYFSIVDTLFFAQNLGENFLIFYQSAEEEILIVRVLHGARDIAALFEEEDS